MTAPNITMYSLNHLKGFTLHAVDGEIGTVSDGYFDDRDWTIRYLVVKTGWLLGREVLITPQALGAVNETEQCIATNLTREQIEKSPSPESDKPLSRQFEEKYHTHYGSMATFWGGQGVGHATPGEMSESMSDPHLRSLSEIKGYSIEATDGQIGNPADFLIEARGWEIRFLVVDTGGWLPGKHVLLAPPWIQNISWHEGSVNVDLARSDIETAPEYHPGEQVTTSDEERLARHYGREVLRLKGGALLSPKTL